MAYSQSGIYGLQGCSHLVEDAGHDLALEDVVDGPLLANTGP